MFAFSQLLIVHHHYKKGGVTDVVMRALTAFTDVKNNPLSFSHITLASGEKVVLPKGVSDKNVHTELVPSLGYCDLKKDYTQSEVLCFLEKHRSPFCLWWVHNHHLGKNPFFTRDLISFLQKTHQPCILQMHDFPESARIKNLQKLEKTIPLPSCYKASENTVFAVINQHDAASLTKGGLNPVIIPNIVPFPHKTQKKNIQHIKTTLSTSFNKKGCTDYLLFTYPVRCIRRKNVFEAALLTKLYQHSFGVKTALVTTLPGLSEQEKHYSETVKTLYKKKYILGSFPLKNPFSFIDVCEASDLIISSSVQEGFGFSYIGAASWGSPLLAREVSVSADNKKVLKTWPCYWYKELKIPYAVLDTSQVQNLVKKYEKKINSVCSFYKTLSFVKKHILTISKTLHAELDVLQKQKYIDFSMLDVPLQLHVLTKLSEDEKTMNIIIKTNKTLLTHMYDLIKKKPYIRKKDIEQVKNNVDKHFSESSFSKKFFDVAQKLTNHKNGHNPVAVAQTMLLQHSHLSYFRLLLD